MSNETTKRLAPLLRKLRGRFADRAARGESTLSGAEVAQGEPVLCALVRALLEWNAGQRTGGESYARLCACFVDLNELRVCSHEEFAAALVGHPARDDRAARLRACLGDVYRREHAMSLAALLEAPKREARHYLESLDGVPRAVAARVGHEMLEIHAVPVDDRLRGLLEDEGVIGAETTADHAASELERAIGAGELKEAVALLLAWADADGRVREVEPGVKPSKSKASASNEPKDATKPAKVGKDGKGAKRPAAKDAKANEGAKDAAKANGAAKAKSAARTKAKSGEGGKGTSNARGRSAKK